MKGLIGKTSKDTAVNVLILILLLLGLVLWFLGILYLCVFVFSVFEKVDWWILAKAAIFLAVSISVKIAAVRLGYDPEYEEPSLEELNERQQYNLGA
jgi:hypothetical protein